MYNLRKFTRRQMNTYGLLTLVGIAALIAGIAVPSKYTMIKTAVIMISVVFFAVFGVFFGLAAATNAGSFEMPTGQRLKALRVRVSIACAVSVALTAILPFVIVSSARVVLLIFGIPISALFLGALISAFDSKREGAVVHAVMSIALAGFLTFIAGDMTDHNYNYFINGVRVEKGFTHIILSLGLFVAAAVFAYLFLHKASRVVNFAFTPEK